ncbi:hypothetical protein E4U43_000361 [Claviceps pusilla]|uniref:Uncharacterized protein n=1 Tax=Claviceps pusilla TaxID=123648 RepID=A0A9P7N9R2_9HYPO|nr:hypothetical protein E4U43_000361 [Claviceps pusilla]
MKIAHAVSAGTCLLDGQPTRKAVKASDTIRTLKRLQPLSEFVEDKVQQVDSLDRHPFKLVAGVGRVE